MPAVSQGSSLLATLGFIAESLWDSRSLGWRDTQMLPYISPCTPDLLDVEGSNILGGTKKL